METEELIKLVDGIYKVCVFLYLHNIVMLTVCSNILVLGNMSPYARLRT